MKNTLKTSSILTYTTIILLFGSAFYIQQHICLNWDVNWLLKCTLSLLHGGSYYTTFCENNPPLIIYLYIPIVLMHAWTGISLATATQIYTFSIAILSLCICRYFLYRIHYKQQNLFLIIMAFAYVLLPCNSFGQREHLMPMLVCPYLIMTAARLTQKSFPKSLAIFVGILAGIGFAIKPYFLPTLALVELYFFWQTRSIRKQLRIEFITLIIVGISYLISLFVLTTNYLYKMVPLVIPYYLNSYIYSWQDLFNIGVFFCLISILCYIAWRYTIKETKALNDILAIAILGFLASYFLQRKIWFIHLYPSIALAAILMVALWRTWLQKVLLLSIFILFPISLTYSNTATAIHAHNYNHTIPIIKYLNQHANNRSIFVFSTNLRISFELIDQYTHSKIIGRFPGLWFLPSLFNKPHTNTDYKIKFTRMIVADIKNNKPDILLVDTDKKKAHLRNFDYIKYFSQAPSFRAIIKKYNYQTTINHFAIYLLKP
jgi:hypothetical protein